jgi:hypothetical protein
VRFKNVFFLLFLVTLFSFQLLSAQTAGTGALTGTIKDPSGAVVPNATVTLTSLDTGASRTSTTGADGGYKFDLLPTGNYKVRIEAAGFKPVEIPSVAVNVTETEVLDRNLEVGAQTQTVTVEGEVVAIQTTSSALGTVADARTVTELPLNTRNYTNLLAMSTGVAANVSNATTIGKGATNMAVNGGATGQNTYLMDGVVVNNWTALGGVTEGTLPGTFAMPNPDAISEFKIQTSSYDAGYGRNPGANVNVITKSGTNQFHGSAFEFFRNTALNANDWFLAGEGQPKAVLNSNVYGGSVGGPVKKDKLFFFVNYQEEDQTNGYASYSQSQTLLPPIPTGNRGTCGPAGFTSVSGCDAAGAAFVKALATNMSASTPQNGNAVIQNPATCGAACDVMGLYNINPIAVSILQLKLPNGSYFVPGSGDFSDCASPTSPCSHRFENPASFKDHQGIGNVDYVINSKNTFSGRYVYEADPINANFPAVNALEPGNAVPGNTVSTQKSNQDVVAKLTTIVSNNAVNEFHVGYQRNVTVNSEAVLFHNSQLGIQDFVSPFTPGAAVDNMSYINIGPGGSFLDFGVHPFFGSHANFNQFIVGDQVSISHGKHTFRVGFDVERVQGASFSGTGSVGQPAFPTFADFLIGRAGCSSAVAGNIAGASSPGLDPAHPGGCNGSAVSNITGTGTTTTANSTSQVNPRVLLPSLFAQDDIKVNSRFTLNLGLRWEFDQWPTENNGNYSTFWQALANNSAPPSLTGVNPATSCIPGAPPSACAGESLIGYVVPSNYTALIPPGVYQNATPYYTRKSAPLDDFAPRIGFAWQPTSSNKLVLRGGAGYFYDLLSGQYTGNFGRANPLFGPPAQGSPAATLQNPWAIPGGVVSAGPGYFGFVPRWIIPGNCASAAGKCTGSSSNSNATSYQDLTIPLTYEWNMNVQYEFLPSWVLELGYVGSHGIHQASPGAVQNNTADGSPINIPYNAAQLVGGGPCVSCAANNVTVNTTANTFLRVPALGITPSATQLETISNYKFNSLQATVRHQFAHGFQLQAAYSWSRGFEQVPTGVNTYPYVVEEYAPEYFVRPQRLILNYVWNLPAPRMNGILGRVIDDWSWSGVVTIQNGQPIDIVDSGDGAIFGLKPQAGNIGQPQLCPGFTASQILTSGSTTQRVANGLVFNPTTGNFNDGWLNSAAFTSCGDAVPKVGAINGVGGASGFGNYGFGEILGPGQSNWDMSLAKTIKIHEAQSLQFRAEFYNTFNHPQFSNLPGSDVQNSEPNQNSNMGQITTTSVSPRVIQFALKFLF